MRSLRAGLQARLPSQDLPAQDFLRLLRSLRRSLRSGPLRPDRSLRSGLRQLSSEGTYLRSEGF